MSARVGLWEHFGRLADFRGRENRASFWPYAAFVYGIMMIGSFAVMIPVMQSVIPELAIFFTGVMILTAVAVLLYAAAVARRLHDAGLSGLWGLMPVPFLAFSMVRMREFFGVSRSSQPDMGQLNQIFASNLIYMLALIALIVLLARRSDPAPNRFDTNRTV